MTDVIYWIWLSTVCNYNYRISEQLLLNLDCDAAKIYNATERDLSEIFSGKPPRISKDTSDAESIYSYCKRYDIGLLHIGHEYYPRRLLRIEDRPVLLYYLGKMRDTDNRLCITAVGTRRMSDYGKRLAYTLSYDLAKAGAIVVSGLALGVDAVCHRAAIDAGGDTIAVLGCGIDVVYPSENAALANEIISRGTVMTEYRPGTPPNRSNFPQRNRILSALSEGTAVIEASAKSGALITAKKALLQGRNIYAVPGNIGELNSDGTNELIRSGAKIVTNAHDILDDYYELYRLYKPQKTDKRPPFFATENNIPKPMKSLYPPKQEKTKPVKAEKTSVKNESAKTEYPPTAAEFEEDKTKNQKRAPRPVVLPLKEQTEDKTPLSLPVSDAPALTEKERTLLEHIPKSEPVDTEQLFGRGMSTSDVLASLTNLEIKGYITPCEGGKIKRTEK